MIACLDVDYRPTETVTANVVIAAFGDAAPAREEVRRVAGPAAPYEPGRFYLRELPHLLAVLAAGPTPNVVVVDGYVWLGQGRPGLGAHLHETTGLVVVGVAKEPFRDNDVAVAVRRGGSERPLFVTAVGMLAAEAADHVRSMHGTHRIPTILRRVDRLARTA